MNADLDTSFELFASSFVSAYWSTVKDGVFSMPPDEPVEESLEELIASVSWEIESSSNGFCQFLMTGVAGDWWRFGFSNKGGYWKLESASSRSDKKNSPNNLLDEVYASYFRPFLEYITNQVNKQI